jgi:hypothetical protein
VSALAFTDHRAMWAGLLPELEHASATLATRLPVEPALARAAVDDARAVASLDRGAPELQAVAGHVRARVGASLPIGGHLLRPLAGWDDLVLAPEKLAQLHAAVDRVRHQGTVLGDWGFLAGRAGASGVRLLFA